MCHYTMLYNRRFFAFITDETVTTRLVDHRSVPPVQRVALRRFQNHRTPFTWDETPYQSVTPLSYERMSMRPSYVLHMKRRRVLRPTTSSWPTIAGQRAADIDRPPRQQRSLLDSPARTRHQWSVTRPRHRSTGAQSGGLLVAIATLSSY